MNGKRLCSTGHPAPLRRERTGRTFRERTLGVLWLHSSVNLVVPRQSHWPGRIFPRRLPEITKAVSITDTQPQPAEKRIASLSRVKRWGFSRLQD